MNKQKHSANTRHAYVIERVKFDISTVLDHAPVVYMFEDLERRPSIFSQEYCAELERRFAEYGFDPEFDYIVLAGNMIAVSCAVSVLAAEYGEVNTLAYDAQKREYVPVRIGIELELEREAG